MERLVVLLDFCASVEVPFELTALFDDDADVLRCEELTVVRRLLFPCFDELSLVWADTFSAWLLFEPRLLLLLQVYIFRRLTFDDDLLVSDFLVETTDVLFDAEAAACPLDLRVVATLPPSRW